MVSEFGTGLKSRLLLSVAASCMALGSASAYAQDQDSDDGETFTLEEILVTAQKRSKTLQDVPVAVSAYTGASLALASARDIRDLAQLVPALNVTQSTATFQTSVLIRGIGTSGFNPGLEPSVGIYVDGVYRSRTGAAVGDFLGLERVEVLRGPQSTLFGKNTSAGVISFITKKPDYEFRGQGEVTYGNFDQKILKAYVTGPLVEDKVAFSLAANYNNRNGFIENLTTGEDVNNRNRWALRGQLLLEPNEDLSVRFIADIARSDEECCAAPFIVQGPNAVFVAALGGRVLPTDGFRREVAFDAELINILDDKGISMEITYDLGFGEFTAITAYREFASDADGDADFNELSNIKNNGEQTDIEIFTQEIRLASTGDNTIDWIIGAFYSDQSLNADNKVLFGPDNRPFFDLRGGFGNIVPGVSNIAGIEFLTQQLAAAGLPIAPIASGAIFADDSGIVSEFFTTDSTSYALFGQFDWHVNSSFTITAGLRYTNEDKDATGIFDIIDPLAALNLLNLVGANGLPDLTNLSNAATFAGLLGAGLDPATATAVLSGIISDPNFVNPFAGFAAFQFFPPRGDFNRTRSEDKFSGNVILAYDVNDDLNIYGSYSRGYKAGGFDVSRDATVQSGGVDDGSQFEFREETVSSFELGFKARLFEGRGALNVALYSQKVEDFQSNLFDGIAFALVNAGDIRVKGLEIDAQFAVSENFTWTFASAYLDAEYIIFENAPCTIDTPLDQQPCSLTGERIDDAPKWTVSTSGVYNAEISEKIGLFARAELYYRGSRFVAADRDPNAFQSSTTILNASFGLYDNDENTWRLTAYVKNITKENFNQIVFDSVAAAGSFNGFPNDPRTYGLTLSFDF